MAARRTNGEGTIYKRKDGRYEGAIFLRTASGKSKRTRVYGQTQQEAHRKLTELKARAQRGIPVPDKKWKLGEYLDYWQENTVQLKRRPATYHRNEAVIRIYLRPGLGKCALTGLSVQLVQTFLDDLVREGRSPAVVHTVRKVLSAALTQAMREELIFRNVARLVELPSYKPEEAQPWAVEEVSLFLQAAKTDSLYPAFALVVHYGFRRGEVLGLRWCDVDFERRLLHVRQQLQRIGGELRLGDVKTDSGRRSEPLTNAAWELLKAHLKAQEEARALARDGWAGDRTDTELVFTTRSGRPIEPRNFFRSFQRICEQHGLRRITIHDLRHTNATLQMNLGIHDRHIQAILGHADVSTTKRIYEHSDMSNKREALEKVEHLFWRGASSRDSRHLLPLGQKIVEQVTTFISGAVAGTRTRDPILTISPGGTAQDRLSEVSRVMDGSKTQWLIGATAVIAAVSIEASLSNHGGAATARTAA